MKGFRTEAVARPWFYGVTIDHDKDGTTTDNGREK